jgi:hypothetical protein
MRYGEVKVASNDELYFRRRAEQELELAQRAVDSAVVRAHYRLAEAYLDKITLPAAKSDVSEWSGAPIKPIFRFSSRKDAP